MNILSLFDGISCGRVAIERAGIPVEKYYASEIDKYAISVSKYNYPDIIQVGDVSQLKGEDFKDIDLMMGGFPCQDLSIAKKNREGLKGERSGLFYEMIRLHKEIKPKWFIYENVASMSKENKEIITDTLKEKDPNTYCIMINGALVSAQNRKRLFWTNIPNVEQPEDKGILLKDILEDEVDEKYYLNSSALKTLNRDSYGAKGSVADKEEKTKTLTASMGGGGGNGIYTKDTIRIGSLNSGGQGDRVYSKDGKSVNLSANGGGRGAKTELYAVGCASRTYPRTKQEGVERQKQIELRKDEKANSMTSVSGDSMVAEQQQIRKLTPIECERLTTLPDNYTAKGEGDVKISNTQRYKMCGNAFIPDVVAHILNKLKK